MINNTPEITQVTSETLQAKIRELLPSQQGFGNDLQASNVILPIIDLTATAEGSGLPVSMQQALAFGSQTAFDVSNTTTSIISGTGFWRVTCGLQTIYDAAGTQSVKFSMSDGLSTKDVYNWTNTSTVSAFGAQFLDFDKVFFLSSGDSLSITATTFGRATGSYRQIADVNGNLVNPSGYIST